MKNKLVGLLRKNPFIITTAVIAVLLVALGSAALAGVFGSRDNQSDGKQTILMDVGDNVSGQLIKADVQLGSVHTIIINNLNIDHTGGLFMILGSRIQTSITGDLTIYGPPGTKQMMDKLVVALQPLTDLSTALTANIPGSFAKTAPKVKVIEVTDGSKFNIGSVNVTASNIHSTSAVASSHQSLSYHFNTTDRSVVYTGDSGPSSNVEHLAQNVDLLIGGSTGN